MPGTALPGVIRSGSYGSGPQRELWNVRRAARVLVIDLNPAEPYARIVLEVPTPTASPSSCGRRWPPLAANRADRRVASPPDAHRQTVGNRRRERPSGKEPACWLASPT